MAGRNKRRGGKVLTIVWLFTAATALIVTLVYFSRIHKMYDAVGQIEASRTEQKENTQKTPDDKVADITKYADGGTITEKGPGDATVKDTVAEPDVDFEELPESNDTETADGENTDDIPAEPTSEPIGEPTAEPTPETEDLGDHPYYYDSKLDPNKPIVALSFDDGPSQYTERILATLEKYGAKATFFMVGYQIEYYTEQVKAVYEAGCQIGNHTTDHTALNKGTGEEIRKRVYDNEELLNTIVPVGKIPVRPPYGNYNDTTKEVVDRPMFNWSVDSRDWETKNAQAVFKQIKADVKDGYIILCHDLYESTAEAVELFVPWLVENGYQVTCISNMYEARGEETHDGHIYRYTNPAPTE